MHDDLYGTVVKQYGSEVYVRPDGHPTEMDEVVVIHCDEFNKADVNPIPGTRVKYERHNGGRSNFAALVAVQCLCWKDAPIRAVRQSQPEYTI